MSFKSNIPEQVLAHPNTRKFVSVMDGVNEVKSDIIFTSLRAYNPALLLDKNWLLKRLGDYGVDFIPMEFPLPIIQQFLLNADIILGTRGSKKGVELFLSVMTLGTVSVNFNSFYADPQVLLLNSLIQGLKTVPIQVHGQEIYPCHHVPTYQNLSPVWTQWMQEVLRLMET